METMGTLEAVQEEVIPQRRPYKPFGVARNLLVNRAPEILISGPAGTGKTRSVLEKIHLCAEKFPGMRALIVRKTRASLTESALVTFEDHVVPESHSVLEGASRGSRRSYLYQNGSIIVIGGMDRASRIMSTEFDLIFVQEAIELQVEEWEALSTRLRNGKMPFQQLIGDTNPDKPGHWLKRRCDEGRTVMLESRHEDNPILWTGTDWTEAGRKYIERLDALTGPRKLRLRYGRWVQAEGVVYDGWDASVHLVDRFALKANWHRYLVIDFGYTNPFVCLWAAVDDDGRIWIYKEIYRTQRLVEDHADEIKRQSQGEKFQAIICDHDAEGRATLEKYLGQRTTAAWKEVRPGIQAVQSRLRPAGDGKPRLYLLRDSLLSADLELRESKRPVCTAEEFDSYVWNTGAKGDKAEEPVKENDHGMDALRYLVAFFDVKPKRKFMVYS